MSKIIRLMLHGDNECNRRQPPKKPLDQCRDALRVKHYSPRTEDTCLHWMEDFIRLHNPGMRRGAGTSEDAALKSLKMETIQVNHNCLTT